jgi:hypothetical protein
MPLRSQAGEETTERDQLSLLGILAVEEVQPCTRQNGSLRAGVGDMVGVKTICENKTARRVASKMPETTGFVEDGRTRGWEQDC